MAPRDKPEGIIRQVDELGRVVLPIEWRKQLGYEVGERFPLEISLVGRSFVLKLADDSCILCGPGAKNVTDFNGRGVCIHCRRDITNNQGTN